MKGLKLQRYNQARNSRRRGAIVVLALILLVVVLAFVAFAVDIGLIVTTKAELQNCADSAAIAGARGLLDSPESAESRAEYFAERNSSAGEPVEFSPNEDLEFGVWDSTSRTFTALAAGSESEATAVRITTRRSSARNNALPLFFARLFGRNSANVSAIAIATAIDNFRGFELPATSQVTLPIMPFTVDEETWRDVQDGIGPDNWSFNGQSEEVEGFWDGVPEMNIFPEGQNAPGNRGYLEIGPTGGKNNTLRRQVLYGVNATDLDYHGGSLQIGDDGTLLLGGRPGTIATLKTEFEAIRGELRIIPIFRSVSGNGNNAVYRLIEWVGVRVMYSDFQGSPKKVIVQPAGITITTGGIPETGDEQKSYEITMSPKLVQ